MLSKNFKIVSVFLLLFSFISSSAQIKVARINVYFEKNSYTVSERMASKLHRVSDSIESWDVEKIYLHGSADGDASSDYNLKLSKERCNSVEMFLTDYGADPNLIALTAHGERVGSEESSSERRKARERRVQIVIGYRTIILNQAAPDTITQDTIITQIDTCTRDTLLDMGDGVFAKMNLCEYERNKECFRLGYFKHVKCSKQKINKFKLRMGFKNYGQCLEPYIAYSFYIKTCADTCFKKPIIVYCPTKYFKNNKAMNNFRRNFNARTKRVKFKGEKYLEFQASCPGYFDCRYRNYCMSCGKNNTPLKIALKRGVTFEGDFYPTLGEDIEKYTIKCNKAFKNSSKIIYPKSFILDSLVLNYKGSTYVIQDVSLDDLRPSWRRCKKWRHTKLGNGSYFLGIKTANWHKRTEEPKFYKIKPKDLENLTNPSWKPSLEDLMKD